MNGGLSEQAVSLLQRYGRLESVLQARELTPFEAGYIPSRITLYTDDDPLPVLEVEGEQQVLPPPGLKPELLEVFFDGEPAYMQTYLGETIYSRLRFVSAARSVQTEEARR